MADIARGLLKTIFFRGSAAYWERRYRRGRNSGSGSYGVNALFKAKFLNTFVDETGVHTVIELGVGDGAQLELAEYKQYVGVDVSKTAIQICKKRFCADGTRRFFDAEERNSWMIIDGYDLSLSLDVVFHLVEDSVYENYMRDLFNLSKKFVIIYSWNDESLVPLWSNYPHVRRRKFTDWINSNAHSWRLDRHEKNNDPEMPGFYVFSRSIDGGGGPI